METCRYGGLKLLDKLRHRLSAACVILRPNFNIQYQRFQPGAVANLRYSGRFLIWLGAVQHTPRMNIIASRLTFADPARQIAGAVDVEIGFSPLWPGSLPFRSVVGFNPHCIYI